MPYGFFLEARGQLAPPGIVCSRSRSGDDDVSLNASFASLYEKAGVPHARDHLQQPPARLSTGTSSTGTLCRGLSGEERHEVHAETPPAPPPRSRSETLMAAVGRRDDGARLLREIRVRPRMPHQALHVRAVCEIAHGT
jgi:hypothetical protein